MSTTFLQYTLRNFMRDWRAFSLRDIFFAFGWQVLDSCSLYAVLIILIFGWADLRVASYGKRIALYNRAANASLIVYRVE